ncbi:macro domain-containing protein [Bauldia sp.]|uniref:macro domain-containing protein n=1 Tax=Bauldia sp. TaxID=2575872 RepID=UPI003BAB62DA
MAITYVVGDATNPVGEDRRIIAHVCNDIGAWGAGFVVAISRRWKEPEKCFREWYRGRDSNNFELGAIQIVSVAETLSVANMVGQHGIARRADSPGKEPPVRYSAITKCLSRLADYALADEASVHMPRIGCGLAGGTWDRIEPLIINNLVQRGVAVTVYDFG